MSSFRLPITETRLRQGAEAERAAIVAWLRSSAWSVVEAANAIERGDHLNGGVNG